MQPRPKVASFSDSQFDPLKGAKDRKIGILGAALNYRAGTQLDWHTHARGQFIYATSGAMLIQTRAECFVVPSLMAVWVPPGVAHWVGMQGATAMRTVYFAKHRSPRSADRCEVVAVSRLLRELILAFIERQASARADDLSLLAAMLWREIAAATPEPLLLPMPSDRRVRPILAMAVSGSLNDTDLREVLKRVPASFRTVERIFERETGLTFGRWWRQAKLLQSISQLAEGKPVTEVALDAGYATPSAYTYMFRRTLGTAPTRYLSPGAK
jgi:AraC-like DNA-binding protein